MHIKELSKICFDFFFPHRCFACKQIVQDNGGLCESCWLKISFIEKPCCAKCRMPLSYQAGSYALCAECLTGDNLFDKLYFVMIFNDFSKSLIHKFKFYDQLYLVKFFAKLIVNYWKDEFNEIDYIIPVPIHKSRLIMRKFNQAALLTQNIAMLLDKKKIIDGLIKYKKTASQANLNKNKRKINIKNSIAVNNKHLDLLKNKNILLIDDVFTTGATVNECVKVLKLKGVTSVKVVTIARVIPDFLKPINF
jgi:ComF family protein